MRQEWWGLGWQWHQLDHIQTICTSLQTDNHTNIKSHDFYRPDALTDAQPTVSRHCRPKLLVTFQETFAPGAIAYQWSVCGGRWPPRLTEQHIVEDRRRQLLGDRLHRAGSTPEGSTERGGAREFELRRVHRRARQPLRVRRDDVRDRRDVTSGGGDDVIVVT